MIPETITYGTPSDAERKLFTLLEGADIGPDYVAYHSLDLAEDKYKIIGELDFVIVGPRGILSLEVKGGRVSVSNGTWTYTNRYGKTTANNRGPFKQVRDGIFSLRDDLTHDLGHDFKYHLMGWGVVFPDIQFDVKSTEWDLEWVLDEPALTRRAGVQSFLLGLYEHWESRPGRKPSPISGTLLGRIMKTLRPAFEKLPTLHGKAAALVDRQVALTENQYKILDAISRVPRVLCEGPAGTGKTMIAMHLARNDARAGRATLLVCRNPVLARHLNREMSSEGIRVIAAGDSGALPVCESLIVDEGQDLLNLDDLDRFDHALDGGLASGRWRFFYDPNNQAGIDGSFDHEALDMMIEMSMEPVQLSDNCRNTSNVVQWVRSSTGADIGVSTAGNGPEVEVVYFRSDEHASSLLEEKLDDLVQNGVTMDSIVLLTTDDHDLLARVPKRWRSNARRLDEYSIVESAPGKLDVATVRDFKGLERQFVCVLVDESDVEAVAARYVAATRARVGLWVAWPESKRAILEQAMEIDEAVAV